MTEQSRAISAMWQHGNAFGGFWSFGFHFREPQQLLFTIAAVRMQASCFMQHQNQCN